jgi:probable phosphoglycerate mutase
MDSKLVVEQMSGRWQIKHADMRTLAQDARSAHNPSLVTYSWIPRDLNSHADRLANKALDGESQPAPRQLNYLTERLRNGEQATNIYFIRHGETILTPDRKFSGQGVLDPELTSTGLAQAELVAQERDRGVAVVMATHELSDADTADMVMLLAQRVVAQGSPATALTDAALRECFGFTQPH